MVIESIEETHQFPIIIQTFSMHWIGFRRTFLKLDTVVFPVDSHRSLKMSDQTRSRLCRAISLHAWILLQLHIAAADIFEQAIWIVKLHDKCSSNFFYTLCEWGQGANVNYNHHLEILDGNIA